MHFFYESFLFSLWQAIRAFFATQWERSILVGWFTSQPFCADSRLEKILPRYHKAFHRLKLDQLLQNSVFQHPLLFASCAIVLSPLLPTMGVLALVLASFFSIAVRLGCHSREPVQGNPLSKYVVIYALVYLYATITSTNPMGSLFHGLLTTIFVLFFLILGFISPEPDKIRRLLAAMVVVGMLIAMYGFYQCLFPSRFRSVWTDTDMFSSITFRAYSTLENPNMLGAFFLLIIPLCAGLLLTDHNRYRRIIYLGSLLAMISCMVLTYSRGCYLGMILAAALFLVLLDRRFLVAGVIILFMSPFFIPESVWTRFTSIGNMADSSTSYRVYIWMGTLAMLHHYWFSGIGPGESAFNTVYPNYAYNAVTAPHSHNLFLQILCDTGICGFLIFLILLIAYYRMMFTAIYHETRRSFKIMQISALSSVSGFLVEGLTDYDFYNYRVMLLFWAVLGISVLLCRPCLVSNSCGVNRETTPFNIESVSL